LKPGRAHELEHLFEVVAALYVEHVAAGEPVQAAAFPMLARQSALLGWRKAIAETADDHPPLDGE